MVSRYGILRATVEGCHAGTGPQGGQQHADLRLADGGDHGLAGVLVALHLGGVGVRALLEEGVELALGAAGVGLDGNAVERVEAEGRGLDLAVTERGVARLSLKLGNHDDVACGGGLDVGGLPLPHMG